MSGCPVSGSGRRKRSSSRKSSGVRVTKAGLVVPRMSVSSPSAGRSLTAMPAGLAPGVVGLGVAAAVREADQGGNRVSLEVGGAAELRRLGAGREGALAPGALGVQRAPVRVRPVDGVRRVDELLVEVAIVRHRAHRIRRRPRRPADSVPRHGARDLREDRPGDGGEPRDRQGDRRGAGPRGRPGGDGEPLARATGAGGRRDRGRDGRLRCRHLRPRSPRGAARGGRGGAGPGRDPGRQHGRPAAGRGARPRAGRNGSGPTDRWCWRRGS